MRELASLGYTLILAGGGGIPVVREAGGLAGVEAVVDKDFTSSLVARKLEAVITSLSCLIPALQGKDGTHIHP